MIVLSARAISVLFRKCFPVPVSARFPQASFHRFLCILSCVEFVDPFRVEFCAGRKVSGVFYVVDQHDQPFLLQLLFLSLSPPPPVCISGLFIKIQVSLGEWTCDRVFNLTSGSSVDQHYLFLHQYHAVFISVAL